MSFLLGKKKSKKVIVFLCTGNTCRGPMAQGYMRKAMEERGVKNVEVKTAGVMTIPGLIPTPEATQVMRNAGIDITGHRSSPLTQELIRKADLILGMTPFHVQFALRESEGAKGKTYLLKEFAESDVKNYQITDPMGMTLEVYKRVYREMKLAIDKMLEGKDFFKVKDEEEERTRLRKASAPPPTAAPAPVAVKKPAAPAVPPGKSATGKPAPGKATAGKTTGGKPAPAKAPAKPAAKTGAKTVTKPAAKATAKAKPVAAPATKKAPAPKAGTTAKR